MKAIIATLSFLSLFVNLRAQVQLDKGLQFTGSGTDARVEGIKSVTQPQDAVSVEVLQRNGLVYAPATASGNSYDVTTTPSFGGPLVAGQIVHFRAPSANTGPVTLNVNGTGAISVAKNVDLPLAANDLKSGQMVSVIYDATNNRWQMLSHTGNSGAPCSVPATPVAGTHTATSGSITWNWTPGSNNVVFFKYNTTNNYATATTVGANFSYTQTGLSVWTNYTLYVWAYNDCGPSAPVVLTKKTNCYAVGESAMGGRIASVAPGACSGLVVQSADVGSNLHWSSCCGPCQNTFVSTSTSVGTGQSNTTNILSTYSPMNCMSPNTGGAAARACDNLVEGGYSDWFLPSKGDFDLITNFSAIGMQNGNWWSSSQAGYCSGCPGYYAWRLTVSGGAPFWDNTSLTGQGLPVRCTRNYLIP